MSEPRRVTLTLPAVKGLTVLEVARASVIAGVTRAETETMLRALVDPAADPIHLERGATLLYAWALQLIRRDEPAATWDEAQTWRVEFDLDYTDAMAEAEAEALVSVAAATGLSLEEAGRLTMTELGVYGEIAERAEAELAGLRGR
jgi:hypothetical protein